MSNQNKQDNLPILNDIAEITTREKVGLFIQDIKLLTLKYLSAIKEIETKIDILSEDFRLKTGTSPIEHVSSRVKSPESIVEKMRRNNIFSLNVQDMENNILDIAGVRITCSFIDDIYKIVDILENSEDLEIVKAKDYIKNPKKSGYRSYHLIVKVPIHLTTGIEKVNVEIQIRTMAMDFWASLEHKIQYKYDGIIPNNIAKDLWDCSEMAFEMDKKMLELQREVEDINE